MNYREATIKKFTAKIPVYWADCDAAGIVYYGNFFRYLEMAEEDLYVFLGRPRTELFRDLQVGFPRVEVWCRYRKPARLGDSLEVTFWIEKRTQTALALHFEMRRAGETDLVAEATSRLVCVNRQFRPVPLPAEFIALFGEYLPPVSSHTHEEKKEHSGGRKHPLAE